MTGRQIGDQVYRGQEVEVASLIGATLKSVAVHKQGYGGYEGDAILFTTEDGTRYMMFHEQDCCEEVIIKDITGDLDRLVGKTLVMAEVVSNEAEKTVYGSQTWTFYKFATADGYVTISWLGESNGYYSETVQFIKVEEALKGEM